jgi:protocatechuate 3,4-dioxygenase beta subunit
MPHAGLKWCFLALAAMAWGQARPAASRPYASIVGVVLDDATGAPIPRVVVKLETKTAEPSDAVAWTDDRGAFAFSRVPPGQYSLSAHRDGYEMTHLGAARREEPPEVLSLASGEDRRVTLRMRPAGSISGTVTDAGGDPLAGVNLSLLVAGYSRRQPHYSRLYGAQTDGRGRYRIGGLPAGKYVLMANAQWQQPAPMPEVVRGQAPEETRYAPLFYPNADRLAVATPIVLAPGKNLEGFDFQLAPQPASSLEGKVVLPADIGPSAQVTVVVSEEDQTLPGSSMGVGINPATGAFEVGGLIPGRYLVTVNVNGQGRPYRGTEHVELGHGPAQVTVHLEPGVELAGSVRLEGDPGGEPPHFRVSLVPGDGLPMYFTRPEAEVKPDGSFRIPNVLPGVWDIGVEPIPKGGYIKSMRLGNRDVLTEDMLIESTTSAPLNIVLSTRGAVIDGAVTDAGGERAKKAYVVLAPSGAREKVWTFYRVIPADGDGHYEFKGVTPGAYTLYALARMDSDPSQDPDFLKPLAGRGEQIEATEGGHATRDVRLIPEAPPAAEAK